MNYNPATDALPLSAYNWEAWHFHEPDGSRFLQVSVMCVFESEGYSSFLRKAVPQSYNTDILVLERVIVPPTLPEATCPNFYRTPACYKEREPANYTHVQILNDHITVRVRNIY